MLNRFKDYEIECDNLGAIIGEVELVDCILVDEEFQAGLRELDSVVYGRSNHIETYAWKLDNIVKYNKPIYVRGKLGLWNYEGDIK